MDSNQIHKAMRDRQPVLYGGTRYDRIADYIAWYDGSQKLQLSVVLISGNSSFRVPADKVKLLNDEKQQIKMEGGGS